VRSPANINADGATRWSANFPGLGILVFALFAGTVIESIP
jgi:MFS superfamily sulfate permease-like transporter